MKHINLLLFVILLAGFTDMSAQSRSGSVSNFKIDKQSEKLRQAIGWKQDILGTWVSNTNAISETKLDEHTLSTVPQNFKWIQFLSVRSGSNDIYVLLYENSVYISGSQTERRVHFYLMTAASYAKIAEAINKKDGQTLTIHSPSYGYMSDKDGDYTSGRLLTLMNQSLVDATNSDQYDFSVNAQHVENEDVVRFRLPEKSSIMSSSLNNSYFEAKWSEFNGILLPLPATKATDEFSLDMPAPVSSGNNAEQTQQLSTQRDDIEERNVPVRTESKNDFAIENTESPATLQQEVIDSIKPDDGLMDRRSKEKAIVSAPVAVFADIEGWYHTSDGEWVNDDNHRYDFETVGRYEWRNFSYRGKAYLLLTRYEKYAGETYYLISKDDYMHTLQDMDKLSMLKFPVLVYAGIGYRFEDVIELCEQTLDTPKKEDAIIFRDRYLVLQYKLSQPKNIARFFMFLQECSRYGSETALENCNIIVSNKIRYHDEPLLMSESMFSKMYYETSYNNFMDFIREPASSVSSVPAQKDTPLTDIDFR